MLPSFISYSINVIQNSSQFNSLALANFFSSLMIANVLQGELWHQFLTVPELKKIRTLKQFGKLDVSRGRET